MIRGLWTNYILSLTFVGVIGGVLVGDELWRLTSESFALFDGCSSLSNCLGRFLALPTATRIGLVVIIMITGARAAHWLRPKKETKQETPTKESRPVLVYINRQIISGCREELRFIVHESCLIIINDSNSRRAGTVRNLSRSGASVDIGKREVCVGNTGTIILLRRRGVFRNKRYTGKGGRESRSCSVDWEAKENSRFML